MRPAMVLRRWNIWLAARFALVAATLVIVAAASPPSATASACSKWGDTVPGKLASKEARKAIVCLLNAARQKVGEHALHTDKRLQKAAQRHTDRMVGSDCFDHLCPGEADLGQRLEIVDYLTGGLTRWIYGENIAWGSGKLGAPKEIVNSWMNSPPHREILLTPSFDDVGVGFRAGTPSNGREQGGIYTADFGLRVG
jgi:uncharacterized protein YkwD